MRGKTEIFLSFVVSICLMAGCRPVLMTETIAVPSKQPTSTSPATSTPAPTPSPHPSATASPSPSASPEPAATIAPDPSPTSEPPATLVPIVVSASNDFANVYSGPGFQYDLVAILSSRIKVEAIGIAVDGLWIVIELPGDAVGWISITNLAENLEYSSLVEIPAPSVPPPTAAPIPQPSVTIFPVAMAPGAEYTITITNFQHHESFVIILYDTQNERKILKTRQVVREDGSTEINLYSSDKAEFGTYVIEVVGDLGSYAKVEFYVGPAP